MALKAYVGAGPRPGTDQRQDVPVPGWTGHSETKSRCAPTELPPSSAANANPSLKCARTAPHRTAPAAGPPPPRAQRWLLSVPMPIQPRPRQTPNRHVRAHSGRRAGQAPRPCNCPDRGTIERAGSHLGRPCHATHSITRHRHRLLSDDARPHCNFR